MKRLAIMLSGRGSNFAAIHEAVGKREIDAEIVAVISNRADAPGLARAREWGYDSYLVDHKTSSSRQEHEEAILQILRSKSTDLVALAGYMRKLSARFVEAFPHRIVNIHPSLLPAFPGVDAQAQAIAHGVKISGCTVHLVDETVDGGPIVVQRAVEVKDDDTAETLAARILVEEHKAYVEALRLLCSREYRVEGRRVLFDW